MVGLSSWNMHFLRNLFGKVCVGWHMASSVTLESWVYSVQVLNCFMFQFSGSSYGQFQLISCKH